MRTDGSVPSELLRSRLKTTLETAQPKLKEKGKASGNRSVRRFVFLLRAQ